MNREIFEQLNNEGLLSNESFNKIKDKDATPLFSVFRELRMLLYAGIILLTTGLAALVYKHINTIGHQSVLLFIAVVFIGCFYFTYKNKKPFSKSKVESPNVFFDLILFFGTASFLIFVGYIQYEYNVFGNHYGMATFIPALLLFYIAYDFDSVIILSLAIVNLGLWMGVVVTPKSLLVNHTFNNQTIIYTYIGFGMLLLAFARLTQFYIIKKHFKFSYLHYGVHICFIALIAGYSFSYRDNKSLIYLFTLLLIAFFIYKDEFKNKSFYFLVLVILYSYLATSCLLIRGLIQSSGEVAFYFILLYFIASATGLVMLLMHINKQLKTA